MAPKTSRQRAIKGTPITPVRKKITPDGMQGSIGQPFRGSFPGPAGKPEETPRSVERCRNGVVEPEESTAAR